MNILEHSRPYLEAALEYSGGTHLLEDVVDMLVSGRGQLWPGKNCAAVTEIIAYPRKKVLHCFLAGGDMDEIISMLEDAKAWGRAQGCTGFTIAGRKGWKRVLADHGFTETLTVLEGPIGPAL